MLLFLFKIGEPRQRLMSGRTGGGNRYRYGTVTTTGEEGMTGPGLREIPAIYCHQSRLQQVCQAIQGSVQLIPNGAVLRVHNAAPSSLVLVS